MKRLLGKTLLKFRCFYRGEECMIHEMQMYPDDSFGPSMLYDKNGALFTCDMEHVEAIGRYIGINDREGKQIYEGDVLDDGSVVEWFDDLTWDSGGSLHSGFYTRKWLSSYNELSYHDSFRGVKVIGNVIQTPELIYKEEQE
jgi:hypothetical protein